MQKLFKPIIYYFSRIRFKQNRSQRESIKWDSLCRRISYHFKDTKLLQKAMTHRSVIENKSDRLESNERLEFLGDAILGAIVTDELFRRFPKESEGELTRTKSFLVNRDTLARRALDIRLGEYLLLGNGEDKSGGRKRKSILCDAYEALIGAIYLDGGIQSAQKFILKHFFNNLETKLNKRLHYNYKSMLLEHVQSEGESAPCYRVLEEIGPDHKKQFTVEVYVSGNVLGTGSGYSKKQAEQGAARQAIKRLGIENGNIKKKNLDLYKGESE